jgi:hypothetical protein
MFRSADFINGQKFLTQTVNAEGDLEVLHRSLQTLAKVPDVISGKS